MKSQDLFLSVVAYVLTLHTVDGINVTIRGANVDNDGYIAIDLLDSQERVRCMTSNRYCCEAETGILGNWSFPNGSLISNRNKLGYPPFFARSRNNNVVQLFRVDNDSIVPSQRGRFCCEVPDDQNVTQRYYINIRTLILLQQIIHIHIIHD